MSDKVKYFFCTDEEIAQYQKTMEILEEIREIFVDQCHRFVEIMRPFINAYMESASDEFERLARKERHFKRYKRMMRRKPVLK